MSQCRALKAPLNLVLEIVKFFLDSSDGRPATVFKGSKALTLWSGMVLSVDDAFEKSVVGKGSLFSEEGDVNAGF